MEHDSFLFINKHPSFIKHETYLAEIIDALKNVILTGLRDGYSKESYLIKNHVNYIKKIESVNNPEGYIHYTAKKLLPNKESYAVKIAMIRAKYSYNSDLAFSIIKVYDLYNHILKEALLRYKLNENEAEDILAKLLSYKP
ncbi:hypothetical protein RclHR1_40080001 [Rhizophagus clarus]|uniref:Uncharacterized protein n=1 Tax=Rhizophagus clarus TaxID=94130 RepID=A0A2Z6RG95_9GLOM|nr:hypothetical protein RclHR1_40080001 [Rhizophagus clarus]GES99915.1 hypothetical protein GLOIN_2v1797444 [Rhizophagus clarus]